VDVVAHQAIGMEVKAEPWLTSFESVQEILAISIVAEDCLPLVASSYDVMDGSRAINSNRPRHPGRLGAS
jgi:hypothetical protein